MGNSFSLLQCTDNLRYGMKKLSIRFIHFVKIRSVSKMVTTFISTVVAGTARPTIYSRLHIQSFKQLLAVNSFFSIPSMTTAITYSTGLLDFLLAVAYFIPQLLPLSLSLSPLIVSPHQTPPPLPHHTSSSSSSSVFLSLNQSEIDQFPTRHRIDNMINPTQVAEAFQVATSSLLVPTHSHTHSHVAPIPTVTPNKPIYQTVGETGEKTLWVCETFPFSTLHLQIYFRLCS